MTEAKWLASPHLYTMIRFLERQVGSARRLRLFGCACCRRVWDLLRLGAARKIVELAEAYADGEASEAELQSADSSADFACLEPQFQRESEPGTQLSACVVDALQAARLLSSPSVDTVLIVQNTSRDQAHDFILSIRNNFGIGIAVRRDEAEFAEKAKLLRDIFGNPFRPVLFNPWWRTPTVLGLADQMYESRDFSLMSILADALQDAGCDCEDVLSHCLGEDPHVRGCFVVDLILGKG